MKPTAALALAASVFAAASVNAAPTLQFDVNAFSTQALNGAGQASPFGGTTHTGSVQFSLGAGQLVGMFIQTVPNGPFANAGFSGFTMTNFSGHVDLSNGQVTGGAIAITLNNADVYSCQIAPGSGAVSTYVGGGFKIEGLTQAGQFNDAQFGNVDVSPWFNTQGQGGLAGSFLQFNFVPNSDGHASSDMDLFVQVAPLPPAVWGGMASLGGIAIARRMRRSARSI